MPTRPCVFCRRTLNRLSQGPQPLPGPSRAPVMGNALTAIPVFRGRISPVLDTCTQLTLLVPGREQLPLRRTLPLKGNSIFERVDEIKCLGVGVVICGAVSSAFYNLLIKNSIELVCGITGDIEEVIVAYRSGTLSNARFRMPGAE